MCKFSGLFQAIHAFMYFHVYPSIFVSQVIEVVFCGDFIWNDGNGKMCVSISVKTCVKIVIFNVEVEDSCIGGRDGGVEE